MVTNIIVTLPHKLYCRPKPPPRTQTPR